jgi:hypothetical protein
MLTSTQKAFTAAFPLATITAKLMNLDKKQWFTTLDEYRNILAHRLSGRPSSNSSYTSELDGTFTQDSHQETWYIPGAATPLNFDKEMLQRCLDEITALLIPLVSAAREFAEEHQPKAAPKSTR